MFVLSLSFVFLCIVVLLTSFFFFFFNDTATTEIYTLSLHDALPIFLAHVGFLLGRRSNPFLGGGKRDQDERQDRKSTRLNSSHANISYAVFCLKKKKKKNIRSQLWSNISNIVYFYLSVIRNALVERS